MLLTIPSRQKGNMFTEAFDQLPTRKMQAISLPGPPEFTLGQERWSGSIVPPTPTVQTAVADPEHYDLVRRYMLTNLQSGFAPADVLRMTQAYAEALIRERWPLSLFFSASILEDTARLIRQVSQELEIAAVP